MKKPQEADIRDEPWNGVGAPWRPDYTLTGRFLAGLSDRFKDYAFFEGAFSGTDVPREGDAAAAETRAWLDAKLADLAAKDEKRAQQSKWRREVEGTYDKHWVQTSIRAAGMREEALFGGRPLEEQRRDKAERLTVAVWALEDKWTALFKRAGYRCECQGECGRRHRIRPAGTPPQCSFTGDDDYMGWFSGSLRSLPKAPHKRLRPKPPIPGAPDEILLCWRCQNGTDRRRRGDES